MKNRIVVCIISILCGIGFLYASQHLATLAHNAPRDDCGPSILETIYTIPAVFFMTSGMCLTIGGVVVIISTLLSEIKK